MSTAQIIPLIPTAPKKRGRSKDARPILLGREEHVRAIRQGIEALEDLEAQVHESQDELRSAVEEERARLEEETGAPVESIEVNDGDGRPVVFSFAKVWKPVPIERREELALALGPSYPAALVLVESVSLAPNVSGARLVEIIGQDAVLALIRAGVVTQDAHLAPSESWDRVRVQVAKYGAPDAQAAVASIEAGRTRPKPRSWK